VLPPTTTFELGDFGKIWYLDEFGIVPEINKELPN